MTKKISTRRVVTVSFVVDLIDILTNLVAAILTGSAVIFAELAQGFVDSIGSLLLVIGYQQSQRPRDLNHPFGYTREVFFWSLVSSMVMLFLGSGFSIWRGYHQLVHPQVIRYKWLALSILFLSVTTNGYALSQGVRRISIPGIPLYHAFNESSRQIVKTALLRDALGTFAAIIGLFSILLYDIFGVEIFDAFGAIYIGILMAVFAIILISQAKNLIIGKAVSLPIKRKIRESTIRIQDVSAINRLAAVYTGSDEIMVDLDLDLKENLNTIAIEKTLDQIKESIVQKIPQVKTVRVDLNSPVSHKKSKK